MSQNDLSIANQGFASFRSDLNSALQALGSTNSGTSAPSTTYANQLFYDTTNNILKIVVYGEASHKIYNSLPNDINVERIKKVCKIILSYVKKKFYNPPIAPIPSFRRLLKIISLYRKIENHKKSKEDFIKEQSEKNVTILNTMYTTGPYTNQMLEYAKDYYKVVEVICLT